MNGSRNKDASWVNRGLVTASECFSCANKVDHRTRGFNVSVLCRDPCKYTPLRESLTRKDD